ncbi:trypsin-like serine protease [Micromonospora sp. ATCC 39149]|uniref:S1 family peptidase n=1 Tax=Micromonospora carbonacea TaxID=47853 RepID=A0A7D5YHI7_9ACTN|nr:trypsin-like serine protease [Micromonospora sp. ATCC 39149]QLK00476.1 S1 family peptidase [Micromonospora carbonacea]
MRRILAGVLGVSSLAAVLLVAAPATARSVPDIATLDRMKVGLDHAADIPAEVSSWRTDPATGTLVIRVRPGGAERARAFARANGVAPGVLRLVEAAGRPEKQAERLLAGSALEMGPAACTLGFAVTQNSTGRAGFVTAGHCATALPGQPLTTQVGKPLGTWAGVVSGDQDMAWLLTDPAWSPAAEVRALGPVNGDEPAGVDAPVCRFGFTTGMHCGQILALNVTVAYPAPDGSYKPVTGLTETSVCAENGDSGGPFVSGDQAQGVLSGSLTDFDCGDEEDRSYFQPIRPILRQFGLSLRTYWQGATPLPGGQQIVSTPAVTTFAGGESVFARRADGQIVTTTRARSDWSPWTVVPGGRTTPSAPAVAVRNGVLYLFVRDNSGRLFVNTATRSAWSGWIEVPGGGSTPSAPAAALIGDALHLIVRAGNDKLAENVYTASGWSGWSVLPGNGSTPDAPAVATVGDTLQLVVHATDGRIYGNIYKDGRWLGWVQVDGNGWTGSPLGVAGYDDKVRIFARGGDNRVYTIATNPGLSYFYRWTPLSPVGLTQDAPAVNVYDSELHLFVRDSKNQLYVATARV